MIVEMTREIIHKLEIYQRIQGKFNLEEEFRDHSQTYRLQRLYADVRWHLLRSNQSCTL